MYYKKICFSFLIFFFFNSTAQNYIEEIKSIKEQQNLIYQKIYSLSNLYSNSPIIKNYNQIKENLYLKLNSLYYTKCYSLEKRNLISTIGFTIIGISPAITTILYTNYEDKEYKKNSKYKKYSLFTGYIGIPISAIIPIVISNKKYKNYLKYQENRKNILSDIQKIDLAILTQKEKEDKEYLFKREFLYEEINKLENSIKDIISNNSFYYQDTILKKAQIEYNDHNTEYLYENNFISKNSFSIKIDSFYNNTNDYISLEYEFKYPIKYIKHIELIPKQTINLKKGIYFFTLKDTIVIYKENKFGNIYNINIPIKYEFNIYYNGEDYEITKKFYKNKKLIKTSYYNNIRTAIENNSENNDSKEEKLNLKEFYFYYKESYK